MHSMLLTAHVSVHFEDQLDIVMSLQCRCQRRSFLWTPGAHSCKVSPPMCMMPACAV